jgi:hypothetical protein
VGFGGLRWKLNLSLFVHIKAWSSRFRETRERFLEDDEDDDVDMEMAVNQFQNFIDYEPPSRSAAGGSHQGRATNIDRDRVIMDAQMHKDYFAERITRGPNIFRRRYRMRRSFFLFYFGKAVCPGCVFCSENGCLWLARIVFVPENDHYAADASTGRVCRCHGRLLSDE